MSSTESEEEVQQVETDEEVEEVETVEYVESHHIPDKSNGRSDGNGGTMLKKHPDGVQERQSGTALDPQLVSSGEDDGEDRLPEASSSRTRLSSMISGRRPRRPVVEIPKLPRSELRRYTHLFGAIIPSAVTPLFLPASGSSRQSSISTSARLPPAPSRSLSPRRPGRRKVYAQEVMASSHDSSSDPIAGEWTDRSSDEDGDVEGSESDDADDEMMRRSTRVTRGNVSRGWAVAPSIKKRLRNGSYALSDSMPRSSSHSSAVSESSFYGSRNPRLKGMTQTKPTSRRRQAIDISSGGTSEYDEQQDSQFEEGEDEVDELESSGDDSMYDSGRGKGRKKGKGKGRARKETSEEEASEGEILSRHRDFCEKCGKVQAEILLEKALARKKRNGGKSKRKKDEDALSEEEEARELEGWLQCDRCVTSWHWGCLGHHQQKDVLTLLALQEGRRPRGERKRASVALDEHFFFQCRQCQNVPECMVCHQTDLPRGHAQPDRATLAGDIRMEGVGDVPMSESQGGSKVKTTHGELVAPIKFRCLRCKQSVHYEHLPFHATGTSGRGQEERSLGEIAEYYQAANEVGGEQWCCHQCREWVWGVDIVIAWRPLPADAQEEENPDEIPSWKDPLPREYLIKFKTRGFRHVRWVSHAWLRALAPQRLRNFLTNGPSLDLITDETLAARGDDMTSPTIAKVMEVEEEKIAGKVRPRHHVHAPGEPAEDEWKGGGPPPDHNAESSIPIAWSTADRILDVFLLAPNHIPQQKKAPKKRARIESDESDDEVFDQMFEGADGVLPDPTERIGIDEWERQTGKELTEDHVDKVANLVCWCYVKWDDLQYDQSTWDTPPPRDSELYPAFKRALGRYLKARKVVIPILTKSQCRDRDDLSKTYRPPKEQPKCIVGGTLMPFQMEGLQWLLTNHFMRKSVILADDMGLGKTIQIASMLGYLGSERHRIYPCLVVVPNSTITNWVREFEKWVPHIRVVPYYGDASSRKVISEYELYHKGLQRKAEGLKAHVVLTTYDMVVGSEFKVFNGIPRWEVVCVDEGQRLKSDQSNIWNNLRKLNSAHRLLLTGTPLNNNIRELFNLLSFLDPVEFSDRDELERRFDQENLSDSALVKELHNMVAPYILRRIKADVLRLPPKIEIIVPISMAKLQKELYKSILERNAEVFQQIMEDRKKRLAAKLARQEAKAAKAIEDKPTDADAPMAGEASEETAVEALVQ